MHEDLGIKIHNLLMKADENGVCDLTRRLWDLKDHFIPWVYDNCWEFRLPTKEQENQDFYAALIVYPTAETIRHRVLIGMNADNLKRLYQKSDRECQEFIDRLHYMLGKPDLPKDYQKHGWDYLLLSNRDETYLFLQEFRYLTQC